MEERGGVKDDTQIKLDFRYLKNIRKALLWKLEVLLGRTPIELRAKHGYTDIIVPEATKQPCPWQSAMYGHPT